MPEKYTTAIDDATGSVEFGDRWSYIEMRQVDTLPDADLMAFLATKMIAVSLPVDETTVLSAPSEFAERWQELDLRWFHWMLGVSIQERGRIGNLGEAMLRASLKSYVEAQTKETTAAPAK